MRRTHTALQAGAAVWCFAILAAPLFHLEPVYKFFSLICHQIPDRSWHLHGEPLAVCIRCASIYFGFLAGLLAGLSPNARLLRIAMAATAAEFVFAWLVMDSAILRSATGLVLGAAAAPFVSLGIEQMLARPIDDFM